MNLTWYNSLNRPPFTPPPWLFGPAWTILYILMAISALLIWKKGINRRNVKAALKLFAIQLILNLIWSPIFFGAHNIILALIVIFVLWYFILRTIQSFYKVDKLASYLLYPYIAWVSFASILNLSIWLLNR